MTAVQNPTPAPGKVPEKWKLKLATYRSCIKRGQDHMEEHCYHEKWKRFRTMYASNPKKTNNPHEACIDVPIAFSNVNIQRAALTVYHPTITVNPRTRSAVTAAIVCEEVLNYEWRRGDMQAEVACAVDDMLIMGNGWVKTGYQLARWGNSEDSNRLNPESSQGLTNAQYEALYGALERPGVDTEFDKMVEESRKLFFKHHRMGDSLPTRSELARSLRENGTIIIHDRAILERISPFDMLVDPDATKLSDAQWIAQRVPIRMDDAKDNTAWEKRVRDQLAAGVKNLANEDSNKVKGANDGNMAGITGGNSDVHEYVIAWEFYDLHDGTMCLFPESMTDDFLVRPEPMPFKFGHPFVPLQNYSVPDEFWAIGELERIESLQYELNETRSDLINDRKTKRRKWIVEEWLWNSGEGHKSIEKVLTSPEHDQIAVVGDVPANKSIAASMVPVPQHDLDFHMYNIGPIIENDIAQVSGISEYQRGTSSLGAGTATEAAIINDGAVARQQEKQGKVETFMREAVRNLLMLKQQYMTVDKVLRITEGGVSASARRFRDRLDDTGVQIQSNPTGMFMSYGRSDISGEFDFDVEVGSSVAFNKQQRQQTALQLLAILSQFFGAGVVDEQEVLRYVVEYGFPDVKDATRFLVQEQPQAPQGTPAVQDERGGLANVGGATGALGGGNPNPLAGLG